MTKAISICISLTLVFTAAACGKDGGGGGGKPKATDLPDLGLVIDLPAGADLSDMTMGDEKTTMIRTSNAAFMVAQGKADKTFEDASSAYKDYDGAKQTKQDKTADGWHIEYTHKTELGDAYSLDLRKTIGGKPYDCTAAARDEAQRQAVIAACNTLRAK
jgi:hypothetical protein